METNEDILQQTALEILDMSDNNLSQDFEGLLQHKLQEINERSAQGLLQQKFGTPVQKMHQIGRTGPNLTQLDSKSSFGIVIREETEILAEESFSSIRANCCVFRGKWMYEITLRTSGVQQIGWCTNDTIFSEQGGVGDSLNSYAFDGKRIKKWNINSSNYGKAWMIGDVIGCLIDLDNGDISYYRNGEDLGIAFSSINKQKNQNQNQNCGYFPAISLEYGEYCSINFGISGFRYPIKGYLSLDILALPSPSSSACVDYILNSIFRLSDSLILLQQQTTIEPKENFKQEAILEKYGKLLLEKIIPLIKQKGNVSICFLPSLLNLVKANQIETLQKVLEIFVKNLENEDISLIFPELFMNLSYYLSTKPSVLMLKNNTFRHYLQLLLFLLKNDKILKSFIESKKFKLFFELAFSSPQPSPYDLNVLFPQNLSQNDQKQIEIATEKVINTISKNFRENEQTRIDMIRCFLDQKWKTDWFQSWISDLIIRNSGYKKARRPSGLSSQFTLLCIFESIISIMMNDSHILNITNSIKDISSDFISRKDFWSIEIEKIGGLDSSTNDSFPIPKSITEKDIKNLNIDEIKSLLSNSNKNISSKKSKSKSKNQNDNINFFWWLTHQMLTLFEISVGEIYKNTVLTSQNLSNSMENARQMTGTDNRLILEEIKGFLRNQCWNRIQFFVTFKQKDLFNLLGFITNLLNDLSSFDVLFVRLPSSYFQTCVDIFRFLRQSEPSFEMNDVSILTSFVKLFSNHLSDSRIANPGVNEILFQSFSSLLQYQEFLEILKNNPQNIKYSLTSILSKFDPKLWVSTTQILYRFWKGNGFGTIIEIDSDSDNILSFFRNELYSICKENSKLFEEFLNFHINTLNSSLSYLKVLISELPIYESNSSGLPAFLKKYSSTFELISSLLKVLELISFGLFNEIILNDVSSIRVIEGCINIIDLVMSGSDSATFDILSALDFRGIEKLSKDQILKPAVGTILNLFETKIEDTNKSKIFFSFLCDYGTDKMTKILTFLCSYNWFGTDNQQQIKTNDLSKNIQKLNRLSQEFQKYLKSTEKRRKLLESTTIPEELMDPIMLTIMIEPVKLPSSGVVVDRRTIVRHLLNSQTDPFNRAELSVEMIKPDFDTLKKVQEFIKNLEK